MLKNVMDYEKRLLADREELLRLIEASEGQSDAIVRDKLQFFQSELMYLNNQYELLCKRAQANPQVQPQMQAVLVQPQQAQMQPQEAVLPKTGREAFGKKISGKKASGLEKTVGTSLMGILASGLIFVSLILFATLLLPYLNDEVKLAGCYLVSFIITGVSLFKLRKDAENKFYLALAGCGVGALYITLLLTNIYFKLIGEIPLFVLIAVWVAFVCYLSKARNKLFHIIGQLGVTISIIFGCVLCASTDESAKFVTLTVFYIFAFGTLYLTHWEKEVSKNIIANLFGLFNIFTLYITSLVTLEESQQLYYLFLILLALTHLVMLFLAKWKGSQISYGVFVSAYGCLLAFFIAGLLENDNMQGLLIYLVSMTLIFMLDYKEKDYRGGEIFGQLTLILPAWIGLGMHSVLYIFGFVCFMVVPPFLLGFLRRNATCRYLGLALLAVYLWRPLPTLVRVIVGIVALVAVYALLWWKKECDSIVFRTILHILGLGFLILVGAGFIGEFDFAQDMGAAIAFILAAIFNTAMSRSCFARNLRTGAKENPTVYNIINLMLMSAGLIIISENTALQIPVILVALVIFLINSKNLLDKYPNLLAGIYVGLKFTVLMVVILTSFEAANYVISSLCIILAIASIVLGFVKEYKYLRIYGLILSMVSVFKLIMVDIRYENTLGNAISFFVSGVLCFAISMIYNYIDKKIVERKEG